jgi:acetylornithine deacetylase/succinyl-diaminopimelate desuccinylase-like protein
MFNAMLHNTVSPTIVRGGSQINVIPSEIVLRLDGRALPGYHGEDMGRELRELLGDDVELTMTRYSPGPAEPDMGLYDALAGVLRQADPQGIPVPWLMPATTDARFFSELGIQTYGYTPMNLPREMNVLRMAHNADERIPVESVRFGAEAIYQVLLRGTA